MTRNLRKEVETSGAVRVAWTGTPAAYDIAASDPTKGVHAGRPCRAIVVGTSGTLVITGLDGTAVTLPAMGMPWQWNVQAIALSASSTGQNVVVLW